MRIDNSRQTVADIAFALLGRIAATLGRAQTSLALRLLNRNVDN